MTGEVPNRTTDPSWPGDIATAALVVDPFEQAFFDMVRLPGLGTLDERLNQFDDTDRLLHARVDSPSAPCSLVHPRSSNR